MGMKKRVVKIFFYDFQMTLRLCNRTLEKGCGAWIALYWPAFVLIFYTGAVYTVFMGYSLVPMMRARESWSLEIFFTFHAFFGMFVYCFFLVWSTEAGFVPNSWRGISPFEESSEFKMTPEMLELSKFTDDLRNNPLDYPPEIRAGVKFLPFVERKTNGQPRVCWKCSDMYKRSLYKPDRTHHCSICACCTLKMDHHCLWIGNCVGFYNHKYFMLFLFYAVLVSLVVCVGMFPRLLFAFRPVWDIEAFFRTDFVVICGYTAALAIVIVIGVFFSFHVQLVLLGTTTIERKEKLESSDPVVSHKAKIAYTKYASDGAYANFTHVFGKNPLLWLFPDARDAEDQDGTYVDWSAYTDVPKDLKAAIEYLERKKNN